MEVFEFIVFGIAIISLVKGIAIWKGMLFDIIAGYNPDNVKDKTGLSHWVGLNIIIFSALAFLSGFAMVVLPEGELYIFIALIAIILPVIILRTIKGSKKFTKKRLAFKFAHDRLGIGKSRW